MTKIEIIKKIRDAGIIGKGGAGFPAYAKLECEAEFVLANGAECEQLLSNDKVLMERFPAEIVEGLRLSMRCVGAKKGYLCIKKKYTKAKDALQRAIGSDKNVELFLLDDFYPAGDEVIMVQEVLGRRVPEGGLPLDVGVVVNNVGSLKKIYKAVAKDENVTRKYVSVNGEVAQPKVVNVPIGMRVSDVLALAGDVTVDAYAIISGGPNMGRLVSGDDVIKKTTGALIVLPADHPLIEKQKLNMAMILKRAKAVCTNCSLCSGMCPRNIIGHNIHPHKIMRAINLGLDSQVNALTGAFLCSGCGVCENFACYMFLSPRMVCQTVKAELIKKGVKNPHRSTLCEGEGANNIQRKIPSKRLKARLGLSNYIDALPLDDNHYLADEVTIMLNQHIGAVSVPTVAVGDTVLAGDKIAEIPTGKLGAVYHASIDGRVGRVSDDSIQIRREK